MAIPFSAAIGTDREMVVGGFGFKQEFPIF
jgi:hypothetical protein